VRRGRESGHALRGGVQRERPRLGRRSRAVVEAGKHVRVEIDHAETIDRRFRGKMSRVSGSLSILHVSQPTEGGVGRYVADLAADQVTRVWRVVVASPTYGDLAAETAAAGAAHIRWTAGRAPGPGSLLDATRLSRIVRDTKPDLVHLHSSKAGFAGRLSLRGRLPTIFQPHAWSFEAVRGPVRPAAIAWERSAARWATVVLCVSEEERERGEDHGIHGRWRVIPNGVDLEKWTEAGDAERAAARARLGLEDRPTVVCVGRLCRQKGQDLLLDAWSDVREAAPRAQLALVGDGPDEDALLRRAPVGIIVAGKRLDVEDWLAAADVVTLPSRWEGMSIGMLEAMARGRSVVATDVAGAREALGGDAGAIVPVEDRTRLSEELVARLIDRSRAAAEGRAGRERAVRYHDLRGMIEAVAELSSSTARSAL
jgi:glycosyltransferase involved in cell wall biosynthesis